MRQGSCCHLINFTFVRKAAIILMPVTRMHHVLNRQQSRAEMATPLSMQRASSIAAIALRPHRSTQQTEETGRGGPGLLRTTRESAMSPFWVSCSAQVSRILPLRTTSATGSRSVPMRCFVSLRPDQAWFLRNQMISPRTCISSTLLDKAFRMDS